MSSERPDHQISTEILLLEGGREKISIQEAFFKEEEATKKIINPFLLLQKSAAAQEASIVISPLIFFSGWLPGVWGFLGAAAPPSPFFLLSVLKFPR